MHSMRLAIVSNSLVAGLFFCGACSSALTPPSGSADAGVGGGNNGSDGGAPATSGGAVAVNPLVISAVTRTPRITTWSVNYWDWMPSYGDSVTGTDSLVSALKPAVMRVGGYNNDANVPDIFDDAAFDKAVAYAHSIGAEPLIQVPHLADNAGHPPTPDTAAAMVRYANITKGYGVKYFSVGNEPDIYTIQGLPSDYSQPAIPGYTPSDYCTSARAYVAAMKAVDPTIQIVGPDLGYKFQAGNADNDWLTPILSDCGDLFDIVSIHRYPFDSLSATLAAASADPIVFRGVINSVRGILQATGQGNKPLALMEMNVVYNATNCVIGASPGTVGGALWLADSVGTAIELGLWTTAVWDISDDDGWSLGLIGLPPIHTPRPAYYAYSLFADHFGPTLTSVLAAPPGVSAHASRDQADDATEVIVINWNTTSAGLAFQVTGLTSAPPSATFVLPPVSMAAVEIPDNGAPRAWSYGEAQRQIASGPQLLMEGPAGAAASDAGSTGTTAAGLTVGTGCVSGTPSTCQAVVLPSPAITTAGTSSGTSLSFGSGAYKWGSYTYAASGVTPPTAMVSSDGVGIQMTANFTNPIDVNNNYMGVGLYFSSSSCVDVSSYTGVKFDFEGDLGGCLLAVGSTASDDITPAEDKRGSCSGTPSTCYGSSFDVVPVAGTTIKVPFSRLTGGRPVATLDQTSLINVQWQFSGPTSHTDAGGCAADITISNVAFY